MPAEDHDEFVELMTAHQGRLFAYVLSLLGDPDQANDVLQEANLVMWRSAHEFQPGTNFRAWAFRIAHFQVMAQRQRQLRARVLFDEKILTLLEPAAREVDEKYEAREQLLAGCLERLDAGHRDLLHRRYTEGQSLEAIAKACGKTCNGVAQALFRIRRNLIDCVTRRLAVAGEN
jgi:RNA polymerase sigma-70 factor (ECF subfamily)